MTTVEQMHAGRCRVTIWVPGDIALNNLHPDTFGALYWCKDWSNLEDWGTDDEGFTIAVMLKEEYLDNLKFELNTLGGNVL